MKQTSALIPLSDISNKSWIWLILIETLNYSLPRDVAEMLEISRKCILFLLLFAITEPTSKAITLHL